MHRRGQSACVPQSVHPPGAGLQGAPLPGGSYVPGTVQFSAHQMCLAVQTPRKWAALAKPVQLGHRTDAAVPTRSALRRLLNDGLPQQLLAGRGSNMVEPRCYLADSPYRCAPPSYCGPGPHCPFAPRCPSFFVRPPAAGTARPGNRVRCASAPAGGAQAAVPLHGTVHVCSGSNSRKNPVCLGAQPVQGTERERQPLSQPIRLCWMQPPSRQLYKPSSSPGAHAPRPRPHPSYGLVSDGAQHVAVHSGVRHCPDLHGPLFCLHSSSAHTPGNNDPIDQEVPSCNLSLIRSMTRSAVFELEQDPGACP